jgi:cation:H+ antiporter
MFLDLGLTANLLLFASAAVVVGVCGVLLTAKAETLARVTGFGQAIIGAVVLGALTSLAGGRLHSPRPGGWSTA